MFRKDILQGTPLIKALAVRTMGCIRVKKLNEYLIDPIKSALQDDDPCNYKMTISSYIYIYLKDVRKTAVLCVPKIFELSSDIVEENGIIGIMQRMLSKEGNAFVYCNLI